MRQRLIRQVVALIEHIDTVFRSRENSATTKSEVRQNQIVIGDDNVGALQFVTGAVKRTLAYVRAPPSTALAVISCHTEPDILCDIIGPVIPVAIPLSPTYSVQHRRIYRQRIRRLGCLHLIRVKGQCRGIPSHGAIQLAKANISTSALGQSEAEFQAAMSLYIRQVLVYKLLLQGNCGGRHHQAFAQHLRHRNAGNSIGDCLTRPCSRLDNANRRRPGIRLFPGRNSGQCIGNFGNHLALAPTRGQRFTFHKRAIGHANGFFGLFCQQELSARASLLDTALAYIPSA